MYLSLIAAALADSSVRTLSQQEELPLLRDHLLVDADRQRLAVADDLEFLLQLLEDGACGRRGGSNRCVFGHDSEAFLKDGRNTRPCRQNIQTGRTTGKNRNE